MITNAGRHLRVCEMMLGRAFSDLAMELRMLEPVDLIADIHHERRGHVKDLVETAAELFFKPGALRVCGTGDVLLGWDTPVNVAIQMELCHPNISAHFRLWIMAKRVGVQLDYLEPMEGETDSTATVQQLAAAIEDSRLKLPWRAVASYHRVLSVPEETRQLDALEWRAMLHH